MKPSLRNGQRAPKRLVQAEHLVLGEHGKPAVGPRRTGTPHHSVEERQRPGQRSTTTEQGEIDVDQRGSGDIEWLSSDWLNPVGQRRSDRKSTRLNSSHLSIST